MSEDISATSGTSPVSGIALNCVPSIVLFVHMYTYEAFASSLISLCFGTRVNFSGSVVAAIRYGVPFFSSLTALPLHDPVSITSTGLPWT